MTGELAKDGGNIKALWSRLKKSDLQTTVWCGTSAYVFAPCFAGLVRGLGVVLNLAIKDLRGRRHHRRTTSTRSGQPPTG
jgi:hypothetical protein